MSVLLQLAIFPTDNGESKSADVARVIDFIRSSGFSYQLNPMGTTIETDTMTQALDLINQSYQIIESCSNRIYCTASFDIRKGAQNCLSEKIKSVENKIGKVNV